MTPQTEGAFEQSVQRDVDELKENNQNNLMKDLPAERILSAIDHLVVDMEEMAGEWNGDESGLKEDRAHLANDIIEASNNLKKLLEELAEQK